MKNELNDWNYIIKKEFEKEYMIKIKLFLNKEYDTKEIYPIKKNIYAQQQKTHPK